MTGKANPELAAERAVIWLVLAWTWVGVPLAWGVWQTLVKCIALFHGDQ
jgi:hypothetical protein